MQGDRFLTTVPSSSNEQTKQSAPAKATANGNGPHRTRNKKHRKDMASAKQFPKQPHGKMCTVAKQSCKDAVICIDGNRNPSIRDLHQPVSRMRPIPFGQSDFYPFGRPTNMWHLRRPTDGSYCGAFLHPLCHRGRKDRCHRTSRCTRIGVSDSVLQNPSSSIPALHYQQGTEVIQHPEAASPAHRIAFHMTTNSAVETASMIQSACHSISQEAAQKVHANVAETSESIKPWTEPGKSVVEGSTNGQNFMAASVGGKEERHRPLHMTNDMAALSVDVLSLLSSQQREPERNERDIALPETARDVASRTLLLSDLTTTTTNASAADNIMSSYELDLGIDFLEKQEM